MGIKDYVTKKKEYFVQQRAYKKEAHAVIKKKADAEFYREKQKQEMRVAQAQAKAQADYKISKYKQKLEIKKKSKTSFGVGGNHFDEGLILFKGVIIF